MPATGLLNEAMADLKATLTAVTGLRVVSDPTKIVPNCVFLDAPSFETIAGGGNIIRVTIPVRVIGSGPAATSARKHPQHRGHSPWLKRCNHGRPAIHA
jgi:hypothetical protein